jgi:hypothetical protein
MSNNKPFSERPGFQEDAPNGTVRVDEPNANPLPPVTLLPWSSGLSTPRCGEA